MATAVQSTGPDARTVWPALEGMDERLRNARRTLTEVRHASEDAVADAALRVRRHPLAAVAGAAAAGALFGAAFGFAAGWFAKRACAE